MPKSIYPDGLDFMTLVQAFFFSHNLYVWPYNLFYGEVCVYCKFVACEEVFTVRGTCMRQCINFELSHDYTFIMAGSNILES